MRALLLFAIGILMLLSLNIAWADEPAPMPGNGPDPLAPLASLLGTWNGTGNSAFGPYTCTTVAARSGAWILSQTHVYMQGQEIESPVQLFGANPDGTFVVYGFDSSGETKYTGTADEHGGHFVLDDPHNTGKYDWTVNPDGTMDGSFSIHFATPPAGWPADFWIKETDTRVSP